ncbi:hypothetical protein WJX82_000450 [Trebouxia sp. C0006]
MKQLRQLRSYKDSTPKRSARVNGLVCRADLRVIAIPGALRKASTNNGLLRAAAQILWQTSVSKSIRPMRCYFLCQSTITACQAP